MQFCCFPFLKNGSQMARNPSCKNLLVNFEDLKVSVTVFAPSCFQPLAGQPKCPPSPALASSSSTVIFSLYPDLQTLLAFCSAASHPARELPVELPQLKLVLAQTQPGRKLSPLFRPQHCEIKTNHPKASTKQSVCSSHLQPTPTPAEEKGSKALPSSE